jgi:hypothetical protein
MGGKGSGGKRANSGRPLALSEKKREALVRDFVARTQLLKIMRKPKPHRARVIRELARKYRIRQRLVTHILTEAEGVTRIRGSEMKFRSEHPHRPPRPI